MAVERRRPLRPLELQRGALLLGERLVHFGKLGREFARVEPGELVAAGQRFGPADFQHRGQDPHQRVRLADHAAEQFLLFLGIAGLGRRMSRGAQTG